MAKSARHTAVSIWRCGWLFIINVWSAHPAHNGYYVSIHGRGAGIWDAYCYYGKVLTDCGIAANTTHLCWRRPNVFDFGPTLYKYYTNVFVLAGISGVEINARHHFISTIDYFTSQEYYQYYIAPSCQSVILYHSSERHIRHSGC